MKRLILFLLITLAFILAFLNPLSIGVSQSQRPDEDRITAYLQTHPLINDSDAEVISVTIQGEALVIDLTEEILPSGNYDEGIFTQFQFDLDRDLKIDSFYMTTFKVEGQPLEFWGRPEPEIGRAVDVPGIDQLPGTGPLAGVKVALSPGHGLYWIETYETWLYQRAEFWGIREDFVNAEIMHYVQAALLNQGATVIQLRELDFNAGIGVTGYPTWYESARQYAIAQGLPSSIYDGSNTNYNSDIRARPYMANYYGADLFISLHNNGWDGTLRGTETYWDINNHPGSYAFANAIHTNVINTIRSEYDPAWPDRRLRATDWSYGEIYFADMPAVLLELAFMDNIVDNSYLHDEAFKMLAANAITQGVCDFWGVTCNETPDPLSQILETPFLIPEYGEGMCDTGWHSFTNQRDQPTYLSLNVNSQEQSNLLALWQTVLPLSGEYQVEVYIPDHDPIEWLCPEITIDEDSGNAVYEISHGDGLYAIQINQAQYENEWVNLGFFNFIGNTSVSIALSNVTGETFQTTTVSSSAMRFTLVHETYDHQIFFPLIH
jgi:N-acetylmuramoyl-L-alanine amidase